MFSDCVVKKFLLMVGSWETSLLKELKYTGQRLFPCVITFVEKCSVVVSFFLLCTVRCCFKLYSGSLKTSPFYELKHAHS